MITIFETTISIFVVLAIYKVIRGIIDNWDEVFKPRGQYSSYWRFLKRSYRKYKKHKVYSEYEKYRREEEENNIKQLKE